MLHAVEVSNVQYKTYCVWFFQISLQMQQLLESSLHSDSWSPVRIKFNWDASYWTKQISSLGMNVMEANWNIKWEVEPH